MLDRVGLGMCISGSIKWFQSDQMTRLERQTNPLLEFIHIFLFVSLMEKKQLMIVSHDKASKAFASMILFPGQVPHSALN